MADIRVLLAEDHVITRQGIRRLLDGEADVRVVGEAGDGEEAVRRVEEMRPDVVIMDVAMPRLSGIEATRRIKEQYPGTAVLVLSAYDNDEYVFGLLEAGAAGYLLKTASGDELVQAIRAVYAGEPVLDPAVARKVIERFRTPGKATGREAVERLSDREMEILKLAARGMSNKEIAGTLSLSKRTVEGHLRSIFDKLVVGSRTEAVIYGLRKGWFSLEEAA